MEDDVFSLAFFCLLGDIWLVLYHVERCKFAGRLCMRLGAVTWALLKRRTSQHPRGRGKRRTQNAERQAALLFFPPTSLCLSLPLSLLFFRLLRSTAQWHLWWWRRSVCSGGMHAYIRPLYYYFSPKVQGRVCVSKEMWGAWTIGEGSFSRYVAAWQKMWSIMCVCVYCTLCEILHNYYKYFLLLSVFAILN